MADKQKRKAIKLCRHKLQQRRISRHKPGKLQPLEEFWPPQWEEHNQEEYQDFQQSHDPEWDQLRKMEEYLRQQREKLQWKEA